MWQTGDDELTPAAPRYAWWRIVLIVLSVMGWGFALYVLAWNFSRQQDPSGDLVISIILWCVSVVMFGVSVRKPWMIALTLAASLLVGLWARGELEVVGRLEAEQAQHRARIDEAARRLAALCTPPHAPIPEAAPWSNQPGDYRGVLLSASGVNDTFGMFYAKAPGWEASDDITQIALVACRTTEGSTPPPCTFMRPAQIPKQGYNPLTGKHYDLGQRHGIKKEFAQLWLTLTHVSLREARTGRELTQWTHRQLVGAQECHYYKGDNIPEGTPFFHTYEELFARLQPWLEGRAPEE